MRHAVTTRWTIRLTLFFLLPALTSGCATFFKQVGAAKAFSECQFRIKEVKDVTLGGVPASQMTEFKILPALWSTAFDQPELMLNFKMIIEVRNPNPVPASMNKVDWVFLVDDREMVRGIIDEKTVLPPGPISIADLPMQIELDVKKVFSSDNALAWMKMAASLSGMGSQTTKVSMKVKPTLEIAGFDYELADYVTVGSEFSAETGRELHKNILKRD